MDQIEKESRWGGDKPIQATGQNLIWLPISTRLVIMLHCQRHPILNSIFHCRFWIANIAFREMNAMCKNNFISKVNQLWTQIKVYFAKPTAWAVFIEGGLLLVTASGTR